MQTLPATTYIYVSAACDAGTVPPDVCPVFDNESQVPDGEEEVNPSSRIELGNASKLEEENGDLSWLHPRNTWGW